MRASLLIDAQNTLGESPCWDPQTGRFLWVDILEKKIFRYNPIDEEIKVARINELIGCLSQTNTGRSILGLQNGIHFFDWETGHLEKVGDPEDHLKDNRFNDGKCDPSGRFWAGTTDKTGVDGNGALYVVDSNLQIRKMIENVGTSNGLAWSPDHRYMYFIDTPTKQVVRYRYFVGTGSIESPEAVVQFPDDAGLPDGMTIDEEGMLWIAHWGGKGISRWDPHNGKQLEFIPVPAVNVTSCAFGGPNLDELYITSARTRMTDDQLSDYPHAGGVFTIKTNVKGIRNFVFNERSG